MRSVFFAALLCAVVTAHPHSMSSQTKQGVRGQFPESQTLASCRSALADSGHAERVLSRRLELLKEVRHDADKSSAQIYELRYPHPRNFAEALSDNHHSNLTGLSAHPSDATLFSGNSGCVLMPEVFIGPYWVKGEHIRSDITDGQPGVPLYIEYQIVDFTTCKPVENMYVDVWHANATGIYSGVIDNTNGNGQDKANLNRTHNRGIQKTDASGVASFKTIFPGHYSIRAPHIHIITTLDPAALPNGTVSGGHVKHVGQAFFDESLISTVEKTYPYTTNMQPLTYNVDDIFMAEESWGPDVDPVMQYVWLGDKPEDGLLAWITVGVNMTAEYDPVHAAVLTSNGGVLDNTLSEVVSNPPTGEKLQLGGSAAYFASLAEAQAGGGAASATAAHDIPSSPEAISSLNSVKL